MTNPFSTNNLINAHDFPLTKGGTGSGRYPAGSGSAKYDSAVKEIERNYGNEDDFQATSISLTIDALDDLKVLISDIPTQLIDIPTVSAEQANTVEQQANIIGDLASSHGDNNKNMALWDFSHALGDARKALEVAVSDHNEDTVADANYALRVAYAMGQSALAHVTNDYFPGNALYY